MRRIIIWCSVLLLVACKSKSPSSDKTSIPVPPESVEAIKKNRAFEVGTRVLDACNSSRFKAFSSSEATDKVRQNATKDKISATCAKLNQRYGRFKGLKLIEVTHNAITEEYIFRYAIDYEKTYFKKELKVTINADNKVSAMATKEIKPAPM